MDVSPARQWLLSFPSRWRERSLAKAGWSAELGPQQLKRPHLQSGCSPQQPVRGTGVNNAPGPRGCENIKRSTFDSTVQPWFVC
jgi:hypothetical protein